MAKLLQGELFEDAWTPIKREAAATETYEDFVAKFKKDAPKTTDDCYTPQPVYEAVLAWLGERVDLSGRPIVRPFYPGGDYVNETYPANCVVVDNPPSSILSKIVRFYVAHKIDFFLFASGLTLFSTVGTLDRVCSVVTNTSITYHNGATVHTGFLTNLFPGTRIFIAASLKQRICSQHHSQPPKPKYDLPDTVVTSARLTRYVKDTDLQIPESESTFIRALDASPQGLFGGGYLISDAQAAAVRDLRPPREELTVELSEREQKILCRLNTNKN